MSPYQTLFPLRQEQKYNQHYVSGSFKDFGCAEASVNVNTALNLLLDREVQKEIYRPLRMYGLSARRGNEIWLGKMGLSEKRKTQLLAIFWEIASKIKHTTKIKNINKLHILGKIHPIFGFINQIRIMINKK